MCVCVCLCLSVCLSVFVYLCAKKCVGVQEAMHHLQQLQPAVASLADLEMQAQRSYWNLKKRWGGPQPTAA